MNKEKAPCKVRITGCSSATWWYKSMIGKEFETDNAGGHYDFVLWEDYCKGKNTVWRHIAQQDCIVIERNGQPIRNQQSEQ